VRHTGLSIPASCHGMHLAPPCFSGISWHHVHMDDIPLFPLGNALFPAGVLTLQVFEVRYLDIVKKCIANQSEFGVVVLLSGREIRTPEGQETLAGVGTMARID